jgi:hypothetical protein
MILHPKPTTSWLVHIWEHPWCWDKPRATWIHLIYHGSDSGSHHLPPYNILCSSLPRLHPNDICSRDSQGGVPKLSRFIFPRFWELKSFDSDLRLEWNLNQSCSSPWKLSNGVLHSTCTHTEIKSIPDFLVVGNQIANLTPNPSFAYTLGCRCPNGSCKPFSTSTLQDLSIDIKNISMWGVLTLAIKLWVFRSLEGLWLFAFGSVSFILTLIPKWGCDNGHVFTTSSYA